MKQQSLVLVKFSFTNQAESKIRPALVISNDSYNSKTQDTMICALTSNTKQVSYSVALEQKELVQGRLPLPSRVRADKIALINKKLIAKSFAKVSDEKYGEVVKEIQRLIGRG